MKSISSIIVAVTALAFAGAGPQDLKSASGEPVQPAVSPRSHAVSAAHSRVDADDPSGPPPASPQGSKAVPSKSSAKSTQAVSSPSEDTGLHHERGLEDNPKDPFAPPGYKPPTRPTRAELPPILAKLKRLAYVSIDPRHGTTAVGDGGRYRLTEDDVVALAALPNLGRLWLGGGVISERAAEALAKNPGLVSLSISLHGPTVGDEDVRMIAKLPKLRSLDLSQSSVTSVGLAYLKGHAALRELNLEATRVGDAGMEAISGNENLTSLNVRATRVDDSGMVYIGKLRHLRSLSVGPNVSNDALAAIEGLVELEEFWGPVHMSDAGLGHLRNMTKLRRLAAGLGLVTDDGLRSIRGLIRLEGLNLQLSKITDKGMEYVGEMGGLLELRLDLTKITDAGMTPVANLKHLQILGCRHTQIGDAALVPIGTLPELECLNLDGTRVTSAGMKSLTRLSSLRVLDLTGTRVHDEGMTYVAKLPHLRTLYVTQTAVGDAGLEKLAGMTGREVNITAYQTKVTQRGASLLRQRNIGVSYEFNPPPVRERNDSTIP